MNRDMHYNGVAALAAACGFSARDSELVATASQAVDELRSGNKMPDGFTVDGKKIPIILTQDYTWDAFNDEDIRPLHIWMPFHFFPGRLSGEDTWDTVSHPSILVGRICSICAALKEEPAGKARDYWLCLLGVVLHVFFDTGSHWSFSGRREDSNGDDRKSPLNPASIVPNIGHAEVAEADNPRAKYKRKGVLHDNIVMFTSILKIAAESLVLGRVPPAVLEKIIPALSAENRTNAFNSVYQEITGKVLPKFNLGLQKKWKKEEWAQARIRYIQRAAIAHLSWFMTLIDTAI